MIGIQWEPVDTLFFREGTPFSAGSASQEDVGGLFPPHPASIAGALRAALARLNGWTGEGRWPEELNDTLGDGPEDLGALSLTGPFLLRDGQPLFPVPRHVLGSVEDGRWRPGVCLRPGTSIACDLGDAVRLPEAPSGNGNPDELKAADGWWLSRPGLEAVLRGMIPETAHLFASRELWHEERRIGLERNDTTRTAQEGMLYGTRHVRPGRGVTLGLRITGVPEGWSLPLDRIVPLGGESRLAECRAWSEDAAIDMPLDEIAATRRLLVIALTPLDLEEDVIVGRAKLTDLGDARVVSACLARPQRIGGWDSLGRRPLPLRSILPAGSALFCEAGDPDSFRKAFMASGGLPRAGARQRLGFGLVALGTWSGEPEAQS